MPSRRDQVQSYQFFVQRVVSALVVRDPDPAQTPFRRIGGASFASIMIGVICLAAVGVYGFVVPGGNTRWQDGNSVIQERETGTRYLYRDGKLHPVLNYSSALLALGSSAETMIVSRNSLVGTARGPQIGIPDAPDSLPAPERMLTGTWSLCTQPAKDETGKTVATSVLTVGERPAGGQAPGDSAILARDPKNERLYLIWHDYRYEITSKKVVLEALALSSEPPTMAGGAWLNALPAGKSIGTRGVEGRGESSSAFETAVAGRVYVVQTASGGNQYYLAERTQLVPLTPLQADIALADPDTRQAYSGQQLRAIPLEADTAVAAPKAQPAGAGREQPPAQRPKIERLVSAQSAMCAAYEPGRSEPTVLLNAQVPPVTEPVRTAEQTADGSPLADRIVIEPGYGALVLALPAPEAPNGTLNLVTDLGRRYPLANDAVVGTLGYADVTPVKLPASLVVRVPSGPALDPDAAKQVVDPQ